MKFERPPSFTDWIPYWSKNSPAEKLGIDKIFDLTQPTCTALTRVTARDMNKPDGREPVLGQGRGLRNHAGLRAPP